MGNSVCRLLKIAVVAGLAFSTCVQSADGSKQDSKKISWMDSKGKKGKQNPTDILESLTQKRSVAAQYVDQVANSECKKIAEISLKNIDHIITIAKKYSKEKGLKKYGRLVNDELNSIRFIKKFKIENVKKDMPQTVAEFLIKRMDEVKDSLSKLQVDSLYTEVLLPNLERHLEVLKKANDKIAKFVGARLLLKKIHRLETMMLFYHVK